MESQRPAKVLLCLDEFEGPHTGGTENQFWLLANSLHDNGFEVSVALLRPSAYLANAVPCFPVHTIGVGSMSSPSSWWNIVRFAFAMRRQGYRLAHLFLNDVSMCLPPLFCCFGIRTIVSRRDLGFWYTKRKLLVLRLVRHFVSRVVANSAAVRTATVQAEGYRPSDVVTIHNAYSRDDRGESDATPVAAGPWTLVLVANLKPIKRMDLALRALQQLVFRGHDVRIQFIGRDGPGTHSFSYLREMQVLAEELSVADRVEFVGSVQDPRDHLAAAHVGILTSDSEGLSNAVIEYLFAARPVVCTDVGGARDLVDDGINGLLVPAGNATRFADAVERLLIQEGFRRSAGANARRTALSRFSVAALVESHRTLYETVLHRKVDVPQ